VSDFLASMAALSRARCEAALAKDSRAALRARAEAAGPAPALRWGRFGLIAEVKSASPSEGAIAPGGVERAAAQAGVYARAGVSAVSVLTEPSSFGGSLEHLRACVAAAGGVGGERGTACMRKDFLVDVLQVDEARAAGAGGVLVIVRMLSQGVLEEMIDRADELGMFTLIEAFDEEDLSRAGLLVERRRRRGADRRVASLVGVNTRDLVTLRVEPDRLERLAGRFPGGCERVAESGLSTPADAALVAGLGYGGALVGTALMRAGDAGALARAMIEAGSAARAGGAGNER
jgi:indole-3-glycerol phosphate synthase